MIAGKRSMSAENYGPLYRASQSDGRHARIGPVTHCLSRRTNMLVCKALRYAVFAGPRTWIEGKAVDQLKKSAELPGIEFAAGMPDLHPGRGLPVGAVWRSPEDPKKIRLYPALIGNDIGCGMALWKLDTPARSFKPAKCAGKLTGLEASPYKNDYPDLLKPICYSTRTNYNIL